ncbi:hypothetical protein ACFQVC_39510 [Streptomyces monticola]|uniref:Uncharacterized protein n=1 Tax=Streptomyces monticola TaxID=2666263 RepID=A0ABW2JX45_9ACTN
MTAGGPLFTAYESLDAYARACAEGTGGTLPVWTGGRTDLLDGIALAEQVYTGRRTPEPLDTGVLVGPLPEPLLAQIRPLARVWVADVAELPDSGSVLLAGTYAELRAEALQHTIERAHADGRPLALLTGRDVHSLSWVAAKQYAAAAPEGPVGVVSELDAAEPVPGADVWCGARDVHRLDVRSLALGRVWRRVLFHGNGKDDQLNLGQFTLCGASPVAALLPGAPGPKCAYGLGCTKPEDKLIPARAIRTAELVLANCFSGALADHAMYDPKYLILLNALDGPAQSVAATLTACDAQRPENLAWLGGSARHGGSVLAVNERLRDINPYPAFIQVGLEQPAAAPDAGGAQETEGAPVDDGSAGLPLHTIGARLAGYLDSGLLGDAYPLRPRLRKLADAALRDAVRTVALSPPDGAAALAALAGEVKSLDLALAHRFAKHHDDPALQFPTYFGERSVAGPQFDHEAPCACGRPLRGTVRRGRLPQLADTVQLVCARCGDVANSHVDAVELRVKSADHAAAGSTLHVVVEAVARRSGTVNLGIVLPLYLDAKVGPVLRRVEARAGETAHAEFSVALDPRATPQAYYFSPYAVHDLGISMARVHFTLSPATGDAQVTT